MFRILSDWLALQNKANINKKLCLVIFDTEKMLILQQGCQSLLYDTFRVIHQFDSKSKFLVLSTCWLLLADT